MGDRPYGVRREGKLDVPVHDGHRVPTQGFGRPPSVGKQAGASAPECAEPGREFRGKPEAPIGLGGPRDVSLVGTTRVRSLAVQVIMRFGELGEGIDPTLAGGLGPQDTLNMTQVGIDRRVDNTRGRCRRRERC